MDKATEANSAAIDRRIQFAKDTLRGIQSLIALMDQKSYLVLVIIGLTSAAFFSVVGPSLGKIEMTLSSRLIAPVTAIWFLLEVSRVLWFSLKSIRSAIALPAMPDAPEMVFPHALVRRYDSNPQRYYERLEALDGGDILRDYAAEIFKISHIFIEKSAQVEDAIKALIRSLLPWVVGILVTIVSRG
jgi:hypothetical protein